MGEGKEVKYDFHGVIPWHLLKKHLKTVEKRIIARMRTAVGDDLFRVQGEMQLIHKLMDLPEALTIAEGEN